MSGTQPMAELAIKIVVNLVDGLSKTPRLRFAWGVPSDPISVGLRGHWPILADGLLDLHAYVGFDGKQILIAPAAANALVRVNGRTLTGHAWCPVAAPGEIELGAARLKVELDGPGFDLPAAPNSTFETLFDGGQLRQRGQALSDAPMVPATPPHVAFGAAGAQTMASGLSDQPSRKPVPPTVGKTPSIRPGTPPTSATDEPEKKPGFWASASLPKKVSLALLPLAVAATWYSMEQPEVTEPARPVQASSTAKTATPRAISEAESVASVSVPRLARNAASPTDIVAAPSAVALQPTLPSASASAAPSASGAAIAPAPSSAAPSSAGPSSAPPPVPSAASTNAPAPDASAARTVTPPGYSERAALDAAFLGNLKDASKIYGKLAEANGDNQAFKLAARLTAENAVRRP